MKEILLLAFIGMFLLSVSSVNAHNIACGTGSIGTCPTAGTECAGTGATCNYQFCTCVVTTTQSGIDSNANYNFTNFTVLSGVTITISTQASGGTGGSTSSGSGGSNGPGETGGGTGGTGQYYSVSGGGTGGSNSGGGGGGAYSASYVGGNGGNTEGGGGGGASASGGPAPSGGAGGGRINIFANAINMSGTITANGDAGGSTSTQYYCGGGGGGGGHVLLYGNFVSISSGTINANGGAGGSCSSYCGGGGGGGGGYILIRYACEYTAGTYNVAVGALGSGGSGGAAATAGSTSVAKMDQPVFHYTAFNVTLKTNNDTAISNAAVNFYEAGTNNVYCNVTTDSNGFIGLGFPNASLNKIYDINITTTANYLQNITYKAARVPGNTTTSANRKWIPETTFSTSKMFTAGHIVPVEIHMLAPWTFYAVGNLSLEDSLPTNTTFVGNILFEKMNTTGAFACDVVPDNTTYFFIDKNDCSYLSYLNVTAKEWLKASYRLKVEGPTAYTSIGQIKSYQLPQAYMRFDIETAT